ncbi:MAG TPA: SBBP repeat-containing protein, partial [Polyangia bacterium]|nr:SBBP repeat-containing protein [Polyangia bacterium]
HRRASIEPATTATVRMDLLGAQRPAEIVGQEPLSGVSNYLLGSDRSKWRTGVPQFGGVRMREVYRGIDLHVYRKGAEVEYDLLVAAGADPARIRLGFSGADDVRLDADGALVLGTAAGTLRHQRPVAYQEIDGVRRPVAARFRRLPGGAFGFALGKYDPARPLVIDPTLVTTRRMGGSGEDWLHDMVMDATGNIYLTGSTDSTDLAFSTVAQPQLKGPSDAFVMRLQANTLNLQYATYFGGGASDVGNAIGVDSSGRAYVVGTTTSQDMFTRNGFQITPVQAEEGFIAVLNATGGGIDYATYFGGLDGGGVVHAFDVAVKGSSEIWLTGETTATRLAFTPNGFQKVLKGGWDAYVMKLDINQVATAQVRYFSYYGGSANDEGDAIAFVPNATGVKIGGATTSPDLPITKKLGDGNPGVDDDWDVFVWRSSGASTFEGSVEIGGHDKDFINAIALDAAANTYVVGSTESDTFPGMTASSQQPVHGGGEHDGYIVKLNTSNSIAYATYLGGGSEDVVYDVTVASTGVAYLTGVTTSVDFPTTANAVSRSLHEPGQLITDGFFVKLDSAGKLAYGTYLGGFGSDQGQVVLTRGANTYVGTASSSIQFPGAPGVLSPDKSDALVTRFQATAVLVVGARPLNSGDTAIQNRLQSTHGMQVIVRTPDELDSFDDNDRDLVVISSTVPSSAVGGRFYGIRAPVILQEMALQDAMAMVPTGQQGAASTQTALKMTLTGDPLSGGVSGNPSVVSSAQKFNWGKPAGAAVKVASLNDTSRTAIYRYEAGTKLVNNDLAAGRRVGFFLHDTTAAALNSTGWKLFDAAVKWAAGF